MSEKCFYHDKFQENTIKYKASRHFDEQFEKLKLDEIHMCTIWCGRDRENVKRTKW